MRLRNIKGSKEAVKKHEWVVHEPTVHKGQWHELFSNQNPIHMEIGMGKGQFIIEHAQRYPKINFIGVEKYSGVLFKALSCVEEANLPNLICLRMDALHLETVFAAGEISRIYLNFSDPWPKERHYKRRLTYKDFLKVYGHILIENGSIVFKTDNKPLFDYSVKSIKNFGFVIETLNYDLHEDEPIDNIRTEYEEKYSKLGYKINRLIAINPKGERNENKI